MKKISITILVLVFVMAFSFNTAAYETAKSYGMGGAYTGLADDATAMLYNPAGLSDSGFIGLQLDFGIGASDTSKISDLMEDIEYLSEDFDAETAKDLDTIFAEFPVIDIEGGLFAGGNFSSFGVGLNIDNKFNTEKVSADVINATNITNTSGILSISRKVETSYDEILGLAYGVNIKTMKTNYINVELDKSDLANANTIVNAEGSGVGIDAGVMVNVTQRVKMGASFNNLLAPSYDLDGKKEVYGFNESTGQWDTEPTVSNFSEEYTPEKSYRIGASVDIPVLNAIVLGDIENYTESGETIVHLGFEKGLLFNGLSVRGGMYSGSESKPTYTLGMGLNLAALHFDAALGSNDGFKDNLNGALSLNFQF
ncbi:MAG: hypothetical protein U5K53_11155 [Halanaerobiales bacterium]|nr:hypothetical protein [Halanaerobiales bacterium]